MFEKHLLGISIQFSLLRAKNGLANVDVESVLAFFLPLRSIFHLCGSGMVIGLVSQDRVPSNIPKRSYHY